MFLLQVVAPNVSDMAGAEEVSLGSDELSESFTAADFTTEQDQGMYWHCFYVVEVTTLMPEK